MYKCDSCGKSSNKGQECIKVPRGKRQIEYHYTVVEEFNGTTIYPRKASEISLNKGDKVVREYSSKGWEIIHEDKLCGICYLKLLAMGRIIPDDGKAVAVNNSESK